MVILALCVTARLGAKEVRSPLALPLFFPPQWAMIFSVKTLSSISSTHTCQCSHSTFHVQYSRGFDDNPGQSQWLSNIVTEEEFEAISLSPVKCIKLTHLWEEHITLLILDKESFILIADDVIL